MTNTVLSALPISRAFDASGLPLGGGLLFTYQAGSTIPLQTYADLSGTVLNSNPVVLDSTGTSTIRYIAGVAYKLVLFDRTGSTALWSLDNYYPPLTVGDGPNVIGAVLYPQTATETLSTIVNFGYPPYTVDRYGTNTTPGTTDMYTAIQTANNAAAAAGASVTFLSGSLYGINVANQAAPLSITTNWICNGPKATIQRLDFSGTVAYYTAKCLKQENLTLRGLVFDGQVTTVAAGSTPNQDLAAAGSYADTSTETLWSQPYGVNFSLTRKCRIEDCTFKNFMRAGLRIESNDVPATASGPPWGTPITISLGNVVDSCFFIRNRGIYGDGLYAEEYENLTITNCYAYDYQRIGFVFQNNSGATAAGANGTLISNCVADYGHDAVVGGVQSNAGFWMEDGDSFQIANCESKNTMIGFFGGYSLTSASGVYRPWSAEHTFTGCKAIRCHQQGFRLEYSGPVHVVLQGCFAEVNRAAATYANCVGGAPCAVEVDLEQSGTIAAGRVEILSSAFDMVGCSALTQVAGINVLNGGVTNNYQANVTVRDCSIRWLASGASLATDSSMQTLYESTSGTNYGYVADVLFSGANNAGAQYTGSATISNWVNHSFGYCMLSSEINGSSSVLRLEDMAVSMRTGGSTTNTGTLFVRNCKLDYRGQVGFAFVNVDSSTILDLDGSHTDRSAWGASAGTTFFQFSNCWLTRQLRIASSAGASTHYPPTGIFTGCRWSLTYQTEPGLRVEKPGGDFTSILMSGCAFIDTGSTSSTNAMIFIDTTDQDIKFMGAGNTFDNTYISGAGGHVITVNATSNDAPQTASGVIATVFGILIALS